MKHDYTDDLAKYGFKPSMVGGGVVVYDKPVGGWLYVITDGEGEAPADKTDSFDLFAYCDGDEFPMMHREFHTYDDLIAALDELKTAPQSGPMKFLFHKIEDLDAGKTFVGRLVARGIEFHLEDNPADIVAGNGLNLFSPIEAQAVRERQGELYALDWKPAGHECPIGYMLELIEAREAKQ